MQQAGALIEVRLFGAMAVRRADGGVVAAREWRTVKNRDLLRILALHSGRAVPGDQLTELLWPGVAVEKARTSLRVAVLQVRRVLGEAAVEREFDGLVLRGAWVDLDAYSGLADQARRHFAEGRLWDGLREAQEAIALHAGELCADVPYAEWALPWRARTVLQHQRLLPDAADAALSLGLLRDAVELAEQAVASDPCAERSFRVLMRGHHRLGETAAALRAFERCRTNLAEELGSDPAPETAALHRGLLLGDPPAEDALPLIGRDGELDAAGRRLATALRDARPTAVVLTGMPGAGADRLADALAAPFASRAVSLRCAPDDEASGGLSARLAAVLPTRRPGGAPAALGRALAAAAPLVVVLHDLQLAGEDDRRALAHAWEAAEGAVALVATMVRRPGQPAVPPPFSQRHEIELGPLDDRAVTELVAAVCRGRPSAALVEHVSSRSGRLAGRVVAATRALLAAGGAVPGTDGAVELSLHTVAPSPGPGAGGIEALLARARGTAPEAGLDVLDVLAVAGSSLPFPLLVELLPQHARGELHAAASQLEDLTVLVQHNDAFGFRHPAVAVHARQWLRPSRRSRLHTQLASRQELPPATRAAHWMATGRPSRAVPLLLHAAVFACEAGEPSAARLLLARAHELTAGLPADPRRDLDILEALGEVWQQLGRHPEALATYEQAIALAREHVPAALPRLHRRCGEAEAAARTRDRGLHHYSRAMALLDEGDVGDVGERASVSAGMAGALALDQPQAAARWARNAVTLADDSGLPAQRSDTRIAAAWHVMGPRRQLPAARQVLDEAVSIAAQAGDTARMERALLVEAWIGALPGNGGRYLPRLARLARGAADPAIAGEARLLEAFVLHQRGSPTFPSRWAALSRPAGSGMAGEREPDARLVALRAQVGALIAVERFRLARAERLLSAMAPMVWGPLHSALQLARAGLAEQHGDVPGAIAVLEPALAEAQERRERLLAGELTARLAALGYASGHQRAAEWLRAAVEALSDASLPREQALLLLAKAESVATLDAVAAADLATAAMFVATNAGLVHVTIAALRARSRHEAAGGDTEAAGASLVQAAELASAASAHHLSRALRGRADALARGLLRQIA